MKGCPDIGKWEYTNLSKGEKHQLETRQMKSVLAILAASILFTLSLIVVPLSLSLRHSMRTINMVSAPLDQIKSCYGSCRPRITLRPKWTRGDEETALEDTRSMTQFGIWLWMNTGVEEGESDTIMPDI